MTRLSQRNHDAVHRQLALHNADRALQLQARQLVSPIAVALSIPLDGVDAVWWLDQSRCRNNCEALTRWITQQLHDGESEHSPDTPLIDTLIPQLQRHFDRRAASLAA